MDGNTESRLLTELWREMARIFGDIKFCEIKGDMCIENYPEKNTPTILIYRNGDIKKQIVTLRELGGERTSIEGERFTRQIQRESVCRSDHDSDLQRLLLTVGAINANDYRVERHKEDRAEPLERVSRNGKASKEIPGDLDDDDWD